MIINMITTAIVQTRKIQCLQSPYHTKKTKKGGILLRVHNMSLRWPLQFKRKPLFTSASRLHSCPCHHEAIWGVQQLSSPQRLHFSLKNGYTGSLKVNVVNNLHIFSLKGSESFPKIYMVWLPPFFHYHRAQSYSTFSFFPCHKRTSERVLS